MKCPLACVALVAFVFGCAVESDSAQKPSDSASQNLFRSESTVGDLLAEIQSTRVSLLAATGNGSSSGSSVEGRLVNNTKNEIRVDINLASPIYLLNSGRGQNMVALRVLQRSGAYLSDGVRSFLSIHPDSSLAVTFEAYCADLHRDNPSTDERFRVVPLPSDLTRAVDKVAEYLKDNSDEDRTVVAQLALWLAQGEPIDSIRDRFPFTPFQERLARLVIQE